MAQPTKMRITADAYYQLPAYTETDLIQLIDGEVIIGMPPIIKHQRIVGKILFLLMTIANKIGGEALTAPTEVYLDTHNIYEPDVLYLRPDSDCVVEEKRIKGAPDLVVEILSPSTAKYDREQKYRTYQQHGVGEYWIVDPIHETIEVWTLGEAGLFKRQGAYWADDTFESVMLAEDVPVKGLYDV